jgi:hypothetical protein
MMTPISTPLRKHLSAGTKALCLLPVVAAAISSHAAAAIVFTADFNDGLANPNLVASGGTITYAGQKAAFGDNARYYLETVDTDYATVSFTVEATLTLASGNNNNIAYMGMGAGTMNSSNFNAPGGPAVFAEIGPASFVGGYARFNDTAANNSNLDGGLKGQNNGGWGNGTVHRVRFSWDASTQIATIAVDQNYTGTFAADFSAVYDGVTTNAGLNSTNNGFNAGNSKIVFGGGAGDSWDDIVVTVVPEPATASVLMAGGAGVLGLMRRRRAVC